MRSTGCEQGRGTSVVITWDRGPATPRHSVPQLTNLRREGLLAGDLDAMVAVGDSLVREGWGTFGVDWWRCAAVAGHPEGMARLAFPRSFRAADRLPVERIEIDYWTFRTTDRSTSDPVLLEADHLLRAGDLEAAERGYRRAHHQGNQLAAYCLYRLAERRDDQQEARRWRRISVLPGTTRPWVPVSRDSTEERLQIVLAEAGDRDAVHELGRRAIDDGRGTIRARRLCLQSAQSGSTDAAYLLGVLIGARSSDRAGQAHWLRRAARTGHLGAARVLGRLVGGLEALHWNGIVEEARRPAISPGPRIDPLAFPRVAPGEPARWRAAAEAGSVDAMVNLALLGDASADWWRLAAAAGDVEAACQYGTLLARNEQDAVEAERWLTEAARTGHARAIGELGSLRARLGRVEEARRLWGQAARLDDAPSRYWLAVDFERLGDHGSAEELLHQAEEAGYGPARERLDRQREWALDPQHAAWWHARRRAEARPMGAPPPLRVVTDAASVSVVSVTSVTSVTSVEAAEPVEPAPPVAARAPDPARVLELLELWDAVQAAVPKEVLEARRDANHLSRRTGMRLSDVHFVRGVRNRCGHPAERGWPTDDELQRALGAARALYRKLGLAERR